MDSKFLIIVLFMLLRNKTDDKSYSLHTLGNFMKEIEVDPNYTLEKIKIVKKIGPYFPEEYIPHINKSIAFTEKFIKINEVADFMKRDEQRYISEHIPMDNGKDRISKIISTVQKEAPYSENKMGIVIDLILNMDKYQKMFGVLTSVMNNQDGLKDPSELIGLIGSLIGDGSPENNAKFKEMTKMLDIIKVLDTPNKEGSKEGSAT